MQRVLLTGASGGVGARLRKLLPQHYPHLRLSDLNAPKDLRADEEFIAADLADMAQVERAVDGMDGIIHMGAYSVEGPWETILQSNIAGTYNLFEAARRKGVKRVVFASSNHVVGFYPRTQRVSTRRDRAARHALWRQQSLRRGDRRALCLQIRPRGSVPAHRQCRRRAARRAQALDLAEAGGSGAAHPHRPRASRPALRDLLRHVGQRPRLVGQFDRLPLRLQAERQFGDDAGACHPGPGAIASRTRSATTTKAATSPRRSSRAGWSGRRRGSDDACNFLICHPGQAAKLRDPGPMRSVSIAESHHGSRLSRSLSWAAHSADRGSAGMTDGEWRWSAP